MPGKFLHAKRRNIVEPTPSLHNQLLVKKQKQC